MVAHLLIKDVHNLIDDFVRAVVAEGQPCHFDTLAQLWYDRGFSFLHWASEAPTKGLASTPPPNTLHLLYRGAMTRLVQPSYIAGSSVPRTSRNEAVEVDAGPGAPATTPTADPSAERAIALRDCDAVQQRDAASVEPSDPRVPGGMQASKDTHTAQESGDANVHVAQPSPPLPAAASRSIDAAAPTQDSPARAHSEASAYVHRPASVQDGLSDAREAAPPVTAVLARHLPGACNTSTDAPNVAQSDAPATDEPHGAAGPSAAPLAAPSSVDLTALSSHPFISQVRRKHLAITAEADKALPHRAPKLSRDDPAQSMQRLDMRVFPQAQIAAVYVLYALYGTQPSKPASQIYISPSHREGLKAAIQVMAAGGVRDGIAMLRSLVAADAIVWGLVECHPAGSRAMRDASGFAVMPSISRKAQTVTDNAVRQAAIHLRQLVPPDSSVQREHGEYVRSLRRLAAAGVDVPDTMLQRLPEELAEKFSAAVANVRHPLATAVKKRKRMADEEVDALDAELDEELEEAEPPAAALPTLAGGGGLAAVMQASAERSRRRRLAEEQWRRQVGRR
eukprot:jgi/Ulvmu1/2889/UM146_0031.1